MAVSSEAPLSAGQEKLPLIWEVFAETTGMLTLPPERTSLCIGDVEISLQDPGQALTEPVWVTTSWRSGVPENGFTVESIEVTAKNSAWNGHVPQSPEEIGAARIGSVVLLSARTRVEAKTFEEAEKKGYDKIDEALALATLSSGGQIKPPWVARIDLASPSNGQPESQYPV
jgi:hypothetical protein